MMHRVQISKTPEMNLWLSDNWVIRAIEFWDCEHSEKHKVPLWPPHEAWLTNNQIRASFGKEWLRHVTIEFQNHDDALAFALAWNGLLEQEQESEQ
jgi:hypothetical protein